jgi:hypothetical protein
MRMRIEANHNCYWCGGFGIVAPEQGVTFGGQECTYCDSAKQIREAKAKAQEIPADLCGQCDKAFIGLSGYTKWCPYCGAKHEGETKTFSPVEFEAALKTV